MSTQKIRKGSRVVILDKISMLYKANIHIPENSDDGDISRLLRQNIKFGFTEEMYKFQSCKGTVINFNSISGCIKILIDGFKDNSITYSFSMNMIDIIPKPKTLFKRDNQLRANLRGVFPKFIKARIK